MDSGLIFPIIVALWAAYLVPQWIRRREHLSAARSVDRFSAAMRVLSRRDEPAPHERRVVSHSYVLMPARQDVQDLVVKRARRVDTAPTRALAPSRVEALPSTDLPSTDLPPVDGDHVGEGHGAFDARRADSLPVTLPRRSPVPGLVLLASLAALPVTALLAVLGVVGGRWVLAPVLTGAVAMVLVRRAAVRRAAARRAAARMRAAAPTRDRRVVAAGVGGGVIPDFVERPFEDPEQPEAVVDDSWTPVPVPPPTYTLKPPAPRRTATVAEPGADPRPVAAPVAAEAVVAAAVVATTASAGSSEPSAPVGVAQDVSPAVAGPEVVAPEEPVRPVARRAVPDLNLVLERRRASGE